MKLRSPRLVTTCSWFVALTLVGVQLAGCDSNRETAAGQCPASDAAISLAGFTPLGENEQGYPEYRHEKTGIVFVKLPGGKFMMGGLQTEERDLLASIPDESPEESRRRLKSFVASEKPRHEVTLSSFLIAKHEVSQAQWKRVMEAETSPSQFKGDDLPVEQVSWKDCQEFCEKTGLSLPTEAQWEYACRAGTDTSFSFGDAEEDLREYGWFYLNSGHNPQRQPQELPDGTKWEQGKVLGEWGCGTHPIGAKKPNGFGLHDMHGNVFEWCQDVYDALYYTKAASRYGDIACTTGSDLRVSRGGSWYFIAWNCRSSRRGRFPSDDRGRDLGFRPCWPLRGSPHPVSPVE